MWIYIVIGVIVLFFLFFFLVYNLLVHDKNRVKEAFSTMDVYLKKRWDLIPNLVEVVKGYAKHESDTLENVIKMRNTYYDDLSNEEKLKTNKEVAKGIQKIMILSENYPELKASDNFKKLSEELTQVEDEIANSRKYYNATVRIYNNHVLMFPSNLVAKILGYHVMDMFSASEDERENVKVEL